MEGYMLHTSVITDDPACGQGGVDECVWNRTAIMSATPIVEITSTYREWDFVMEQVDINFVSSNPVYATAPSKIINRTGSKYDDVGVTPRDLIKAGKLHL